jgi:hypothetical protein
MPIPYTLATMLLTTCLSPEPSGPSYHEAIEKVYSTVNRISRQKRNVRRFHHKAPSLRAAAFIPFKFPRRLEGFPTTVVSGLEASTSLLTRMPARSLIFMRFIHSPFFPRSVLAKCLPVYGLIAGRTSKAALEMGDAVSSVISFFAAST